MEATNALGQKIDLLNTTPSYFARLTLHSRTSSYSTQTSSRDESSTTTSAPSSSSHRHQSSSSSSAAKASGHLASPACSAVRTPQLVRFDSSSSQTSLQTPSPMTPDYPFEPLEQQKTVTPSIPYYRIDGPYYAPSPQLPMQLAPDPSQLYYDNPLEKSNEVLIQEGIYPSLPLSDVPIQPQFAQLHMDQSLSLSPPQPAILPAAIVPIPIPAIADNNLSSETKSPAKKKFPCPHAARFGCLDTFTTSGHAARHGKKHTGEKNIHCPTCNKACTRMDNMKQHERSHRPDGGAASTIPSLRASASSSSSITASEMKEAHSAQRKRQKMARARGPSVAASLVSNEQQSPSMDEMDDDEDEAEEVVQYTHVKVERPKAMQPSRPQMRRADPTESLGHNQHLRIGSTTVGQDGRPLFDRTISGDTQDGEGESPGLDALAMAASGMLS